MKEKLIRLLEARNNLVGTLERELKTSDPELLRWINDQWLFGDSNFSERLRFAIYGETPQCEYGNRKRVVKFSDGYVNCGKQCQCAKEQKERTMILRHGVKHALQSEEIKAKAASTLLETHGTDKLHLANQKQKKETNQHRYGADFPLLNSNILAKTRETYFEENGVRFPFQSDAFQSETQAYWASDEGVARSKEIKAKLRDKNREVFANEMGTHGQILTDSDMFSVELRKHSREELARKIGCSVSLIDKRINEWHLDEFQKMPSYYEVLIERHLADLGVNFQKNTRKVIAPKELDYYLPDHKLAIEFHGLKWHSELFGKKDSSYHLHKYVACREHGIRLIQIFQDEWDESSHIVKDLISKSIGVTNRVMARKTRVSPINGIESKAFLNENHLQGFVPGVTSYGLFLGEDLLSVMTFTSTNKGCELVRFANKVGITVVGGAAKLLNAYVTKYRPESMFTYSDNRWFDGSLYQNLGFSLIGDTQPGYHYLVNGRREHRLGFTKKRLVEQGNDSSKTEWEIMQSLGYDRIWDCGHRKWVLKQNEQ